MSLTPFASVARNLTGTPVERATHSARLREKGFAELERLEGLDRFSLPVLTSDAIKRTNFEIRVALPMGNTLIDMEMDQRIKDAVKHAHLVTAQAQLAQLKAPINIQGVPFFAGHDAIDLHVDEIITNFTAGGTKLEGKLAREITEHARSAKEVTAPARGVTSRDIAHTTHAL
jgi:hypothetical protein